MHLPWLHRSTDTWYWTWILARSWKYLVRTGRRSGMNNDDVWQWGWKCVHRRSRERRQLLFPQNQIMGRTRSDAEDHPDPRQIVEDSLEYNKRLVPCVTIRRDWLCRVLGYTLSSLSLNTPKGRQRKRNPQMRWRPTLQRGQTICYKSRWRRDYPLPTLWGLRGDICSCFEPPCRWKHHITNTPADH